MTFIGAYFDQYNEDEDIQVLCPFPHSTGTKGVTFYESNPSASINLDKEVFYCHSCGRGYSDVQFIQAILGCSPAKARKLHNLFHSPWDTHQWEQNTDFTDIIAIKLKDLGITPNVARELNIRAYPGTRDVIAFPVIMHDSVLDIRRYRPGESPKVKSEPKTITGLIIPYDTWRESPVTRTTLICAGEKDMAVARSQGFNAITITGGEHKVPIALKPFLNRSIAICYDNDEAGQKGARKLAKHLYKYTHNIRIVTGFHKVCKNEKEDIADFFTKYNKTADDLKKYIGETELYKPAEEEIQDKNLIPLSEASQPNKLGKILHSNVQTVGISDSSYACPSEAIVTLKDTNEVREWELDEDNIESILELIDRSISTNQAKQSIRKYCNVKMPEEQSPVNITSRVTIYKATVTDLVETRTQDTSNNEFVAYTLNKKLDSGKKYCITYKIVPHPARGQENIMIILDAQSANDSISNFKIDDEVKEHIDMFHNLNKDVGENINMQSELMKGFIGYNGNNKLIATIDLAFNTPLEFDFGYQKGIRAYLDTIIVGESRVGKSSTADALRSLYKLGAFTSLAGSAATIGGLVGGSAKTPNGGHQTRAGIIPQNHKGLVIFEEFGKSDKNIISQLTDIRSSNEVRIARVSGTTTMPAFVRMITLTNPKVIDGHIKSIGSYPHGIAVLTELVTTAEDIARYDIALILSDKGDSHIDPLWELPKPFPEEAYRSRIRWIWTRTKDQIKFVNDSDKLIVQLSNELNEKYESHIKIFGTETWKKLARLAIAVAGYTGSHSDNYEEILIQPEHVEAAQRFLVKIYDNDTFKLKEYVTAEKMFTKIDNEGVASLQEIWMKQPSLIMTLESSADTSESILRASTGLKADDLSPQLQKLTRGRFIKYVKNTIIPTERFRQGLKHINKNTYVTEIGEEQKE